MEEIDNLKDICSTQVGDGERLWVSEYRVDVGGILTKEHGLKNILHYIWYKDKTSKIRYFYFAFS